MTNVNREEAIKTLEGIVKSSSILGGYAGFLTRIAKTGTLILSSLQIDGSAIASNALTMTG